MTRERSVDVADRGTPASQLFAIHRRQQERAVAIDVRTAGRLPRDQTVALRPPINAQQLERLEAEVRNIVHSAPPDSQATTARGRLPIADKPRLRPHTDTPQPTIDIVDIEPPSEALLQHVASPIQTIGSETIRSTSSVEIHPHRHLDDYHTVHVPSTRTSTPAVPSPIGLMALPSRPAYLSVIPEHAVVFPAPFRKCQAVVVYLMNFARVRVAYKLKTTSPDLFYCNPFVGYLPPGHQVEVHIGLRSSDCQRRVQQQLHKQHSFMMYAYPVVMKDGEVMPPISPDDFWSQPVKLGQLQTKKLLVNFLPSPPAEVVASSAQTDEQNMRDAQTQNYATPTIGRRRLVSTGTDASVLGVDSGGELALTSSESDVDECAAAVASNPGGVVQYRQSGDDRRLVERDVGLVLDARQSSTDESVLDSALPRPPPNYMPEFTNAGMQADNMLVMVKSPETINSQYFDVDSRTKSCTVMTTVPPTTTPTKLLTYDRPLSHEALPFKVDTCGDANRPTPGHWPEQPLCQALTYVVDDHDQHWTAPTSPTSTVDHQQHHQLPAVTQPYVVDGGVTVLNIDVRPIERSPSNDNVGSGARPTGEAFVGTPDIPRANTVSSNSGRSSTGHIHRIPAASNDTFSHAMDRSVDYGGRSNTSRGILKNGDSPKSQPSPAVSFHSSAVLSPLSSEEPRMGSIDERIRRYDQRQGPPSTTSRSSSRPITIEHMSSRPMSTRGTSTGYRSSSRSESNPIRTDGQLKLALDDNSSDFEAKITNRASPGSSTRYKSERTIVEESKTTTVRTYRRPSSRASTEEGIPLTPDHVGVFEAQPVRVSSAASQHPDRDRDAGDIVYSSHMSETEAFTEKSTTYPEKDHERDSIVYRYLPTIRAGLDEQDRSIYETSVVQN